MIKLIHGDCLEKMKDIPDKSMDMVLCDLPYGITACKWDVVIPFEPLWEQYKRIIKDRGAIVLFGSEPFSSYLRMSNIKDYKCEWYWKKERGTNFVQAKRYPMKVIESAIVFCEKTPNYFPIMRSVKPYFHVLPKQSNSGTQHMDSKSIDDYGNRIIKYYDKAYPTNILEISRDNMSAGKSFHPTQKPVALLEYLIKTYTLEGETVLDNCMGSGSTGVACLNTNRNFIGIEKDDKYFEIAKKRIEEAKSIFDIGEK